MELPGEDKFSSSSFSSSSSKTIEDDEENEDEEDGVCPLPILRSDVYCATVARAAVTAVTASIAGIMGGACRMM